ncbi:MAG: DciA family protein [Gammaproteobacteria bacterium]
MKLKYFHNLAASGLASKTKKPQSVSDLLAEAPGLLARLRDGTAAADRTLAALRRLLPPELGAQVWGAAFADGTLTAFVHSAAWGTRLRYAAPALLAPLSESMGEPVVALKVKVRAERRR